VICSPSTSLFRPAWSLGGKLGGDTSFQLNALPVLVLALPSPDPDADAVDDEMLRSSGGAEEDED
jgi:hypothetical protein